MSKLDVHHSSKSAEHYTPFSIWQRASHVMGGIDLDPCSNSHDDPIVYAARRHFTKEDDGLVQEWRGKVFMNPPYGRAIGKWVAKLVKEHEAGRVKQAVALIPSRTDTRWFAQFDPFPVCFLRGRVTFIGNSNPAPFPSAVVYLGHAHGARFFRHEFGELGAIRVTL